MAAGLGFKTFNTGDVLSAADVNGYLMQGVLVFASEAARNAAITSPEEGQFAYTKDNNSLWYYSGSAWVASGATGDIEGVTAGTGISGGGTSGTVTITNSMATAIDAKGDLVVGTGADTFDRLAVGTNGHTLVADSSTATGLKWAAPAGGGGMTLLASGDLSGSVVNLTSISGSYKDLIITLANIDLADGARAVYIKVNDTNIVGMSNIYSTSLGHGANNSFIYVASSDSAYYMSTDPDNAFSFRISNYADTNQKKAIFGAGGYRYIGDAPIRGYLFYGATENSNAVTELNITTVSTTFSGGKYKLYGVS